MAALAGDGPTREKQPGRDAGAASDRCLDVERGAVPAAAVERGRDARSDHPLDVDEAARDELVVRLLGHRSERVDVAGEREVHVRVDQAGQRGRLRKRVPASVLGSRDTIVRPNLDNPLAFDEDRPVRDWLCVGAVDEVTDLDPD